MKDNKKYSVVYIVENERLTTEVTSLTAMKKLLKDIINYRIYDEAGTDVTGLFRNKGLR